VNENIVNVENLLYFVRNEMFDGISYTDVEKSVTLQGVS
jgi:hypothetical protein